jgi:branched-chain amino acid transport system permease protein
MSLINQALIYTIMTLGLNIVLGTAGQMSLATAAFWGIGAYTSALLTVKAGISFWIAFPLSGLVAAVFGMLLGFPSLKVKGHYLAMVTIGFGEITYLILKNYSALTGGPNGISNIPPVSVAGFVLSNSFRYYYLILVVASVAVLFCRRMRRSRMGRALIAISDREIIAGSMGINTHLYKVLAFMLSAFWAGIAGSLYAHYYHYINPSIFVFSESVKVMCMLFIGGAGTVLGPIVGSFLLSMLPEWLRFMQEIYMAVYGLGVALMMIFLPTGIMGMTFLFRKIGQSLRPQAISR